MSALVIIPFPVTDGSLSYSNIAEDDYSAWAIGTTYDEGDYVIRTSTHKVYLSVADGNLGKTPETDDGTWWIEVGATNKWRPFDAKLGQSASKTDAVQYIIGLPSRMDAIALIGVVAVEAIITVEDPDENVTFTETRELLDTSGIASWLDFFTYEDTYDPEVVFSGIDALSGYTMQITINNPGGTASVAEICAGRVENLGDIVDGAASGFIDYSTKLIDDFGNITVYKRPTARKAEWEISFDTRSNKRIQTALQDARGAPAFFYPGDDMTDFYLSVYGVADEFLPRLGAGGKTQATLSLTGVT